MAKALRENVAAVVAFYTSSAKDMRWENYGAGISSEERAALGKMQTEHRYARLCFALRYPFGCELEIPPTSIKND